MKRFLKIVGVLALFTVVIAYVAFRVLFFDPFGGVRATLDPMIPIDVDVMVRRKDLARDFEPFPMPSFFKLLRLRDEWKRFERTGWFDEAIPAAAIGEVFSQAEQLSSQLAPLDAMDDLLGREAMFLGRWREDGTLAKALVVRGSFRAKLFAEGVKFGLLRGIPGDLIADYAEAEGVRSFTVRGERVHLARSEDAIICGDDADLVREIVRLADGSGSIGLDESPQYRAAVLAPAPFGRPLDFVVDVAETAKRLGLKWGESAPDDELMAKFARGALAPEGFGQAMGRLLLGGEIELALSAVVDRERVRPTAGGLLDGATIDLAELHGFCGRVFPEDVAVAGYARLDMREFFRRLESLLDPDSRQLLNDMVAGLKRDARFQAKTAVELLDALAGCITNELAFALQPQDPYHVPGTEEGVMQMPDPRWGPRIALVFPAVDAATADAFVGWIVDAAKARPTVVLNVWRWSYGETFPGGFWEIKLGDSALPTFSISSVELQKRPCIVLTTTGAFLDRIFRQKFEVEQGARRGLQEELAYRQALDAAQGFGQGMLYLSTSRLRRVLHDYCEVLAEDRTRPDWTVIRREIERRVAGERNPGRGERPPDEALRKEIEPEVDLEIERLEREWRDVTLPRAIEEQRGDLEGLDVVRWIMATMRVQERELSLRVRIASVADFAGQ